jgi:hypothetical protein
MPQVVAEHLFIFFIINFTGLSYEFSTGEEFKMWQQKALQIKIVKHIF